MEQFDWLIGPAKFAPAKSFQLRTKLLRPIPFDSFDSFRKYESWLQLNTPHLNELDDPKVLLPE